MDTRSLLVYRFENRRSWVPIHRVGGYVPFLFLLKSLEKGRKGCSQVNQGEIGKGSMMVYKFVHLVFSVQNFHGLLKFAILSRKIQGSLNPFQHTLICLKIYMKIFILRPVRPQKAKCTNIWMVGVFACVPGSTMSNKQWLS